MHSDKRNRVVEIHGAGLNVICEREKLSPQSMSS